MCSNTFFNKSKFFKGQLLLSEYEVNSLPLGSIVKKPNWRNGGIIRTLNGWFRLSGSFAGDFLWSDGWKVVYNSAVVDPILVYPVVSGRRLSKLPNGTIIRSTESRTELYRKMSGGWQSLSPYPSGRLLDFEGCPGTFFLIEVGSVASAGEHVCGCSLTQAVSLEEAHDKIRSLCDKGDNQRTVSELLNTAQRLLEEARKLL